MNLQASHPTTKGLEPRNTSSNYLVNHTSCHSVKPTRYNLPITAASSRPTSCRLQASTDYDTVISGPRCLLISSAALLQTRLIQQPNCRNVLMTTVASTQSTLGQPSVIQPGHVEDHQLVCSRDPQRATKINSPKWANSIMVVTTNIPPTSTSCRAQINSVATTNVSC